MSGADIVILGQLAWEDRSIGSNCKNIAIELSKQNRVLYVNSPLDRITRWKYRNDREIVRKARVIKGIENGLRSVDNGLWVLSPDCLLESVNWMPGRLLFDFFNKRNNRLLAESIKHAVDTLGFRDFFLINDNEIHRGFYLKEYLNPKISIYYSRDYLLGVNYWKRHGKRLEPKLIAKSDLCFANSQYLTDYCLQYNPRSYDIGQGCDTDFMAIDVATERPEELKDIKTPIIGYVGALNGNRLDIGIIEHIALSFPDCEIVLVGPEDREFKSSRLHHIKNVRFLGHRPAGELARYVNAFDVCINPQQVNSITIGNYPRKIDEYLAVGKPVVATYTAAMETFKEYLYLAHTKEDYVDLIKRALAENTDDLGLMRRAFASTHTWANSVAAMSTAILNHML